jgi:glutamine synthetase
MQHVTMDVSCVDEDMFADGVMFDGSSIAGWKAINESDMVLMPDTATAHIDPFFAQSTMASSVTFSSRSDRRSLQPRPALHRQEGRSLSQGRPASATPSTSARSRVLHLRRCQVHGPTPTTPASSSIPRNCRPTTDTDYETGNLGHRPRTKGGYFPVPPVDSCQDMRSEMLTVMAEMGVVVEKHHHEVAVRPARAVAWFRHPDPHGRQDADLQVWRPSGRPCLRQDGNLHAEAGLRRQRLGHARPPVDLEGRQADLRRRRVCRPVRDLPVLHRRHHQARQGLNAFTNPSTNSYKRLVPGYEAPVLLAYSARNRSASCRIPFGPSPKAKRVEVRFPDPTANPYLAFAAMLMAGIDGIKNKIHPGDPMDKDLYDLPPRNSRRSRPSAVRCVKPSKPSTRIASS